MAAAPGMAVNSGARVWTPFKDLQLVVEAAIHKKQPDAIHDLEVTLRKHKSDFLSLLKIPPKNAAHRDTVKKSKTVGLPIHGEQRTQTFPEGVIEEALIISDLFNLNEFAALELLMAGEENRPDFPGLTRGLVAVLLFYDGRRSIVLSLRTLLLSLEGRTWTLGLSPDLTNLTNGYVQQLVEENLTDKILTIIKEMNLTKELDKLQNNRALGPPKHRKQVQDIYEETKLTCAECLFSLACQRPLNKRDTLRLIAHLREDNSLEADGSLHPVTLCLLMTLLYCFDVSVLEREDTDEVTQQMPVFGDATYITDIHKEMKEGNWVVPGLKAVAQFAWGIMLRQLSQYPAAPGAGDSYEEDEMLIDTAMEGQVFRFLLSSVVTTSKFHKEEFHLRRIHGLLTDFIFHMPLKVKEVRNRGDEAARIVMAHLQEGQEPPPTIRRDFEHFLNLVGELYRQDQLDLELALEYWCPPEPVTLQDTYHHRPPQRQVALYKFVRMAGDLLPASLYVPYIHMLTGLASTQQCAQHCYNLLKMNGGSSSPVSWDHIFTSLTQYYSSLRRESPGSSEMTHAYRTPHSRIISPQELDGLLAVLTLTQKIVDQSENCRVALCENQQWSVVMSIYGLVTCSVPPLMKAMLLRTLAALAKTPEIASGLWQTLEASQVLVTVPAAGGKQVGGIQVELEEIEARNEEYPMTRAFLTLLSTLTDTPVPVALGAGVRAPGFDPYLHFIMDSVFLKFNNRAYKRPAEKWETAALALGIMKKLLFNHEIRAENFMEQKLEVQGGGTVEANKPPGHTLLLHVLKDSRLLQMILRLLDDAMNQLLTYVKSQGGEELEKVTLLCLQLIEGSLEREDQFVAMVRETGSALLVTPMDRLLLGINPRTGKADHLVTVAKYMMFNSSLPQHAMTAMRILYLVSKSAPIQAELVTLFTEHEDTSVELLHGFVECLDVDDPEEEQDLEVKEEDLSSSVMRNLTRQYLLQLMIYSLDQAAPSLAHFLLGFEIRKPVAKTNLQDPGVLNSPKTCLHSVLTILSRDMGSNSAPQCLAETPKLAELCYRLVYLLAANKDTSAPTLRYLRTSRDFLYRQLQQLPFSTAGFTNHQSWLLKTVAVELRLTSLNRQRSHTHRLMKLLLDDYDEEQTSVMQAVGQGGDETELPSYSRYGDMSTYQSQYGKNVRGQQTRRRLLNLLDSVDFCQQYPTQLQLEFFDPQLIQQVIGSVERRNEDRVVFYDVKLLHRILENELNNLQGTTMAGQRQMIQEEIGGILKTMIQRNKVCESLHSKHQAFDAWRQVTEVILTACPEDLLSGEMRQTLLFELLQDLLIKVADDNALTDLTAPVAGVILTLMANLRQCFMSEDQDQREQDQRETRYISQLDKTQTTSQTVNWGQGSGSRTLFATSLQMTLKGVIEYIMRSSGGQQRVRAKLYGALLYYLQIAQKPRAATTHLQDEKTKSVESRLLAATDSEYDQLRKENIATILSYGDTFMDLVCRDACDGLDVGRMLSLSVLDSILTMDKFHQWMSFLQSKGYLQHLVDSLAADDNNLLAVLGSGTENLKALYLFESKMSLLTRVGEKAEGASTLLRCGIMQRLAVCTFFDVRPDIDRNQPLHHVEEEFLPDPISRYRHLLFASLKLCLAILTSLGLENTEAGLQVMHFLVAHVDVFQTILRNKQTTLNLYSLQELALTTAVVARANYHDEASLDAEGDTAAIEFSGHRARIQRQMIALLPKYCLSEKLNKQLRNLEIHAAQEKRDVRAEITQAYLEVATNVTSYCRNILTMSGTGAQYCRVLFGPSLEEALARDLRSSDELSVSTLSMTQAPNLGVVVYQLKHCSNQFMTVYESRKQHLRKLEGLSELSSEDLKQFAGVTGADKMSSQQRQVAAKKKLTQIVACYYTELQSYSYIIENCLFMLWRHLEYYLKYCVPVDQQPALYQSQARRQQNIRRLHDMLGTSRSGMESPQPELVPNSEVPEPRRGVSLQEIDTLKQASVSVLSDSLFKKLLDINQIFCKGRSHYEFVEAVIRRIKRLLRLHTGS